jgi:hypothetical protein
MDADEASWDSEAQVAALLGLLRASGEAASSAAAGGGAAVAPRLLEDRRLLRRFLRARRGDVEAAAAMLRAHSAWRAEKCGGWWPEANVPVARVRAQLASGKAYCHGADRKGRPAAWVRVRLHDAKAPREEVFLMTTFLIDEAVARCEVSGCEQASVVIDFEGFGMANHDIEAASHLMSLLSSNFPERLGALIFVRESLLFWMAWKVVSLFVDARTARKISFLGSDFRGALLREFDDAAVPAWLGGASDYVYDAAHVDAPAGPNPCE